MSTHAVALISARFTALWLAAIGTGRFVQRLTESSSFTRLSQGRVVANLLASSASLIAGAVLWFGATAFAASVERLTADLDDDGTAGDSMTNEVRGSHAGTRGWLAGGVALVGIWLIVAAASPFLFYVVQAIIGPGGHIPGYVQGVRRDSAVSAVGLAAKMALGLLLVMKREPIAARIAAEAGPT